MSNLFDMGTAIQNLSKTKGGVQTILYGMIFLGALLAIILIVGLYGTILIRPQVLRVVCCQN